jgi:hypothetical protein
VSSGGIFELVGVSHPTIRMLTALSKDDLHGWRPLLHVSIFILVHTVRKIIPSHSAFKFAETAISASDRIALPAMPLNSVSFLEVMLYVLLSRFKFETTEAEVSWNMFNFATPTVDGMPSLPLRVTLLG